MENQPLEPRPSSKGFLFALLLVTLLAAGLRLFRLESPSLWLDELATVRTCAEMNHRSWQQHQYSKVLGYVPTFLGLRWAGVDLSRVDPEDSEDWLAQGITEFPLRLPSCLVGILTVPLLGWAARRPLGNRAAVIFALLLALSTWHIQYSQAARFYSQQFLFYGLSLFVYFSATERGSRAGIAWASAFLVLAYLSQPPALILAGVFAADWLMALLRRKPVRLGVAGWAAAAAGVAVVIAAFWIDLRHKPHLVALFVGSFHQTPTKMLLGTLWMVTGPVALFSGLAGLWLLRSRPRLAIYLGLAAVIPPAVFAALSMRQFIGLRYGLICLPGWLALAAVGADALYEALRPRVGRLMAWAPLGLLAAPLLVMDHSYFTDGYGFHERWREAYAYVQEHRQPGDKVTAGSIYFSLMSRYYMQDNSTVIEFPKSAEDMEAVGQRTWIIVKAEGGVEGREFEWLDQAADLKAYFNLHLVQPYSAVHVYLYTPGTAAVAGSEGVPPSRGSSS